MFLSSPSSASSTDTTFIASTCPWTATYGLGRSGSRLVDRPVPVVPLVCILHRAMQSLELHRGDSLDKRPTRANDPFSNSRWKNQTSILASTTLRIAEERPNDDGSPGFDDDLEEHRHGQSSAHPLSHLRGAHERCPNRQSRHNQRF